MSALIKPKVMIMGAGRMGMIRYNLMKDGKFANFIGFYTNDLAEKQKLKDNNFPVIENFEEGLQQADGIWITTPTSTHKEIIIKLAPLGKPIACEKPISDDTESIKEIYEFCAKHNCKLIPCFQRRQDEKCKKFLEELDPDWKHIRMIARENPILDPATLANMGSCFIDLFCHDVNQILWYTNGELPVAVQASGFNTISTSTAIDYAVAYFQYKSGKIVTFEITRFSPDNYDQRVEAMSEKQKLKLEFPDYNIPYSFPERYKDAFLEEINYFSNVLQGKQVPLIHPQEHCILTSFLCEKLKESNMLEKKIYITPKPKKVLRQIGYGVFGSFIDQIVLQKALDKIEVLEYFRRSKQHMNIQQIFEDKNTDAIYICSPDSTHFDYAKACLINRKHVLCEKPINSNFRQLANVANSTEKVLMIGFQRRFDDRFLSANQYVLANKQNIKSITINSFDACAAAQNTYNLEEAKFVIANSLSHDFDCLQLCFPTEIIEIVNVQSQINSGIIVQGLIKSPLNQQQQMCDFQINFNKGNQLYTQKIIVQTKSSEIMTFGEDYDPSKSKYNTMCEYYEKAYVKQFDYFFSLINGQHYDKTLLNSYKKTFDLMECAQNIIGQKLQQK